MLLRVAFPLLRTVQTLLRLKVLGTKCVLHRGDEVVLVRHTYGPARWDLPGGWIKHGEDPIETASREVREELGVCAARWRPSGESRLRANPRHRMFGFAGAVASGALHPDPGEIAEARWFGRRDLPAARAPWVKTFVEGHYCPRR